MADISSLLREHLEHARTGSYRLEAVASEFASRMEAEHPDEWDAWLHERASIFVRREMTRLDSGMRTATLRRASARSFKEAAEAGDVTGFLDVPYVVDEENTRKLLADMTGADHRFVAGHYEATGKEALLRAAFHKAIAKKVGTKTTAEVFTEAQIEGIWKNLTK